MPDNAAARMNALGNNYHDFVRRHPTAAIDFEASIEELLSDAGVTFDRVVARLKTWPSLKTKAKKKREDGSFVYPDPWLDIHDLVGVRVTVFNSTEIPAAIEALRRSFQVIKEVDKAAETRIAGGFGYGSHHLVLKVSEDTAAFEGLADYPDQRFEVQIRTVLQHAWAEFEHDIRYKRGPKALAPGVDRAFTLAAGLIELADQQFDQIAAMTRHDHDTSDNEDHSIPFSAETLPGVLAMLVGDRFPRSKSEHYKWLEELLHANGITTISELAELLSDEDIDAVKEAMNYRFQPSQVRLIDDLLLWRFGEEHIERTQHSGSRAEGRPDRLRNRLKKLQQR